VASGNANGALSRTASTWLAFSLALSLALPQPPNPAHIFLGALAGLIVIIVGFFFASRCRPISRRPLRDRTRLTALSLVSGAALGAILLAALVAAAMAEPALRARFAGRLAEPVWRPWALAFESSILEEVTFRLFIMSVIGWSATRLVKSQGAAFVIALFTSATVFGLAHLPAWSALVHTTPALMLVVLLLNGVGGVLLGWIFWHWGLPYAILCHFAGDVVIQVLGPRLLA
jgi:membrane protease YdiL (CAAX protease family)